MGEGVVGYEAAGVVVAAGPGRGKAIAAAGGSGEGALGGATACRAVGGGGVVLVTIDPEELTADIKDEFHGDEWGSLVDLSEVLEGGGIFSDRSEEGFGSER